MGWRNQIQENVLFLSMHGPVSPYPKNPCLVASLKVVLQGTSINPARSFGPALIKNEWEDHWVFWVGPLLGGALGGGLYKLVFFNKKDVMLMS